MKVPTGLVSGEFSVFLACRRPPSPCVFTQFFLCVFMEGGEGERERAEGVHECTSSVSSSPYKDASPTGLKHHPYRRSVTGAARRLGAGIFHSHIQQLMLDLGFQQELLAEYLQVPSGRQVPSMSIPRAQESPAEAM